MDLGTRKVDKSVRIILSFLYMVFSFFITTSVIGSIEMHDAVHQEISEYATEHPQAFVYKESSRLRKEFVELHDHPIFLAEISGSVITLLMVIGLLSIGEGKVIDFRKSRMFSWLFKRD